uniref:Plus3 domain-containing protein n=1 Tax=Heterorhabditis bacteriophora TaxID=37862 RepID=A0A1I7X0N3_HETBA
MSRDELRSEVVSLVNRLTKSKKNKLLTSTQIKRMKKSELIGFIQQHQVLEVPQEVNNNNNNIDYLEPSLYQIFPFEEGIFSNYKEFKGVIRETKYENQNNEINLEEYLDKLDNRGFDYYQKIIKRKFNAFLKKKENSVKNDMFNKNIKISLRLKFEKRKTMLYNHFLYKLKLENCVLVKIDKSFIVVICQLRNYRKEKPSSIKEHPDYYEIRFLDSFGFNPASLDCLSKNLNDDQCEITSNYYGNEDIFKIMRRKGVYPYEYMDSFKKYEFTELPSINKFDDSLNNKKCTEDEYQYANQVWNKMNCQNLGDYTEIYMINDVLLLKIEYERLWIRSLLVLHITWIIMGCNVKKDKN